MKTTESQGYRFTGLWVILIKFMGKWAIWRRGYTSYQDALVALQYEQERTSWSLKIHKIRG